VVREHTSVVLDNLSLKVELNRNPQREERSGKRQKKNEFLTAFIWPIDASRSYLNYKGKCHSSVKQMVNRRAFTHLKMRRLHPATMSSLEWKSDLRPGIPIPPPRESRLQRELELHRGEGLRAKVGTPRARATRPKQT
jgi:hypothetical protein